MAIFNLYYTVGRFYPISASWKWGLAGSTMGFLDFADQLLAAGAAAALPAH